MKALRFNCSNCKTELSLTVTDPHVETACPTCDSEIGLNLFPALIKQLPAGGAGETLLIDDESSCFYHPSKKAAIVCEGCGRFLCSLCDVEWGKGHLCSSCIESGIVKGTIENVKNEYVLYDDIALSLAVLPMLTIILVYFTFITAPIALYISIRYWKTPMSELPRTRWRLRAAALIAGLQLIGWGLFVVFLVGEFL